MQAGKRLIPLKRCYETRVANVNEKCKRLVTFGKSFPVDGPQNPLILGQQRYKNQQLMYKTLDFPAQGRLTCLEHGGLVYCNVAFGK